MPLDQAQFDSAWNEIVKDAGRDFRKSGQSLGKLFDLSGFDGHHVLPKTLLASASATSPKNF